MHIALLHSLDPRDRRSWSGIPYHMVAALEARGHKVTPIGPMAPPELRLAQALAVAAQATGRARRSHQHTWLTAQGYARVAMQRLADVRPDVIFAPAASAEIAALETEIPIVYFSDATFRLLVDYYEVFSGLSVRSRQEGDEIERAAIERASAAIFSNQWAADSAMRDYRAPPSKVAVAPFGPALDEIPLRERAVAERPRDALRMLFLGVRWQAKGGDIAVDALRALRAGGIPATLTVCGCEPPPRAQTPGLKVAPRVDKRDPEDRVRLGRLLAQSHLMLLPTRYDCSPVAFSEAAAHGLPVVSTRTGAVHEVVLDGETGVLLDIEAGGVDYAREIAALWSDQERLARMRSAARARYEARLNWEAWARDVEACLALGAAPRAPLA